MLKRIKSHYLLIILIIILAACQAPPPSPPEPVVETLVVTEVVQATPVEVIQVVTPTPEPTGSRTLVVCLNWEPESLNFVYPFRYHIEILEAIFDGPINNNSYGFQPVILEKLPSLKDGDMTLNQVTVREDDMVVDANGGLVTLDAAADPPIMIIPSGGGEPVPFLGEEIEMDQLSATYKLLPDLLWSDGEPLTAADSIHAYYLAGDPIVGADWSIGNLLAERTASYEELDDRTIQWTGVPGFLEGNIAFYFFGPVPEHIWSQYSADELLQAEEYTRSPVGWGPYMLAKWIPGESIILHKNPHYFRADEGLPKFDTLVFRITGENTNANLAALLSGECDLVSAPLDDQTDLILDLQAAGKLKASFTAGTVWEHLDFGIQHIDYDDGYQLGVDRPDYFSDVRTRRAFAMCLDRQALVDTIFYGQSLVPDSYVPPQHPLYNQEVRHYDFDVTAGSALLEEVGWLDEDGDPGTPRVSQGIPNVLDGTPLEVDYGTTSTTVRQQVTSILQESLARCGIKTNLQFYDSSEWFADGPEGKLFGRHFDLGQFAWAAGPELWCGYDSLFVNGPPGETWISIQDGKERTFSDWGWDGQNQIGFADDEYDQVCQIAMNSLPGQSEYVVAHMEAQRIFAEQLPLVPLYLLIKMSAMRPDMCGVIMDPTAFSELWNIEEFDYGEGCEE